MLTFVQIKKNRHGEYRKFRSCTCSIWNRAFSESYICNILANRDAMKLDALKNGLKEAGFELVITVTIKKYSEENLTTLRKYV